MAIVPVYLANDAGHVLTADDDVWIAVAGLTAEIAERTQPPDYTALAGDAEFYRSQMLSLLPVGIAWPKDPSSVWSAVMGAIAEGMARIDRRINELVGESDPRTAYETIEDWETTYGLPDPCSGQQVTLQGRRLMLISRVTARGGQTPAYFVSVAAALGFSISIEEHGLFRCDEAQCDVTPLNEDGWSYTWTVRAPEVTETVFRCDQSTTGEPLLAFGNQRLECAILRLKPAHTNVLFAYGA